VAELVAYEAVGLGRRASKAVLEFDGRLKFMSKSNNQAWNTKYGPRRVRYEPPTLREAIAAAQGLSDELNEQAEIAASLIGLSRDQVRTELLKAAPAMPAFAWRLNDCQVAAVLTYIRNSWGNAASSR
jgi:mono/diheme cytochrome c family protein